MRNCNATVLNIVTWAQQYFGKPLSHNTVCCCIKKCNLKLCYARRKQYILNNTIQKHHRFLWAQAHEPNDGRNKCVLSDESMYQLVFGKNGHWLLCVKYETDHPDCLSVKSVKANICHGIAIHQCSWHGWLACVNVPLAQRCILGFEESICCYQGSGVSQEVHGNAWQCQASFCTGYNNVASQMHSSASYSKCMVHYK